MQTQDHNCCDHSQPQWKFNDNSKAAVFDILSSIQPGKNSVSALFKNIF